MFNISFIFLPLHPVQMFPHTSLIDKISQRIPSISICSSPAVTFLPNILSLPISNISRLIFPIFHAAQAERNWDWVAHSVHSHLTHRPVSCAVSLHLFFRVRLCWCSQSATPVRCYKPSSSSSLFAAAVWSIWHMTVVAVARMIVPRSKIWNRQNVIKDFNIFLRVLAKFVKHIRCSSLTGVKKKQ